MPPPKMFDNMATAQFDHRVLALRGKTHREVIGSMPRRRLEPDFVVDDVIALDEARLPRVDDGHVTRRCHPVVLPIEVRVEDVAQSEACGRTVVPEGDAPCPSSEAHHELGPHGCAPGAFPSSGRVPAG